MPEPFIVRSAKSDATLKFTERSHEGFIVAFQNAQSRGAIAVWCYGDEGAFTAMFLEMAENWRGWNETLE